MSLRVVVLSKADDDILQAAEWYDDRQLGLGGRFLQEISHALARLAENPAQFPAIEPGIRCAFLNRFPYTVFFTTNEEEVVVTAVVHQSRHPATWRAR